MSDISEARQALRDIARAQIAVYTPATEDALAAVTPTPLGEVAGPLFMVIQNVLTVAEELRAEGESPVSNTDRYASFGKRTVKAVQRETADRIETAVLKGLKP